MTKLLKVMLVMGFFILGFYALSFSQQEDITITTYYPSPYGVYKELRLYPNTAPSACNANNKGALYYDDAVGQQVIKVCRETAPAAYAWEAMGGAGSWAASLTNPNNIYNTNTGNVGIGTMSPAGKLDVNGAIYQRGGVLHADYVFEPSYKLESIEEHAQYMLKNKHLKAVPEAKHDEDGQEMIEIGANNRGVLEELEKSHLYIYFLNEKIKSLEEKIAALEK